MKKEDGMTLAALLAAAVEVHRPELSTDFVRVRRLAVLDAEGKAFR